MKKAPKYLLSPSPHFCGKGFLEKYFVFPNAGKGNFPNQTPHTLPFPRAAGSMRMAHCLLSAPKTAFACSIFDCILFP